MAQTLRPLKYATHVVIGFVGIAGKSVFQTNAAKRCARPFYVYHRGMSW